MRFSSAFGLATVLLAPILVSAAPLKRGTDAGTQTVLGKLIRSRFPRLGGIDVTCLEFAFVLEQLETEFYKQGLSKFKSEDFMNAGFRSSDIAIEEITVIQQDEATHVTVIEVCVHYLPPLMSPILPSIF